MAWVVQIDFQEGAGWEDITNNVILPTFVRRRQIWNRLRPTVNTLDFKLKTESSALIAKFMTASDDILIDVNKDGSDYFTGMIQPNYSVEVGQRIAPFDIHCVDNGYRIQRRITANINWTNYKVCDPTTVASSIVHQLMVAAGLTTSDVYGSIATINKTIDRFVGVAGEADVWDLMSDILFDFGYTFFFRADGKLDVHDFAPSSISTSNRFTSDPTDTQNIVGPLKVERNVAEYEAVRVKWATHKTLTNQILFSDTTNGDAARKCNISVAASAYWPTDADARDIYADYRIDGYDLVATSNVSLAMEKDAAITQDTFTDEILRAKIKFHNSGGSTAYIRRFDILGDAIVKDQYNVQVRIMSSGTRKYMDLDSAYLYAATDADKLCDAVAQYYYNSARRYALRSRTAYEPGAYAYVEETGFLGINNLCIVQEVADVELTGEHSYVLEGIAAYSAGSVSSTGSVNVPFPTNRQNVYTIAADGYAGSADAYCDGTADQAEINAGIAALSSLYGGGIIRCIGGTFNISAAIELDNGIMLEISPDSVLNKNCNDHCIEIIGSGGAPLTNVTICGGGKIKQDASDSNENSIIYGQYGSNVIIERLTIHDIKLAAIVFENVSGMIAENVIDDLVDGPVNSTALAIYVSSFSAEEMIIRDNRITNVIASYGSAIGIQAGGNNIKIKTNYVGDIIGRVSAVVDGIQALLGDVHCSGNTVTGVRNVGYPASGNGIDASSAADKAQLDANKISDCNKAIYVDSGNEISQIGNNFCYDNGQLIDHADCETITAPHVTADGASLSDATFARSSAQKYVGDYSYLFTKTIASGTAAYAWLVDNNTTTDMHGLDLDQGSYKLRAYVYVPSGGIAYGEVELIVSQYYSGSWNDTLVAAANSYDAWQKVEATLTLDASCTGIRIGFMAASTAENGEIFYVDQIELIPMGVANEHSMNFADSGTGTLIFGNSWM